MNHLSIIHSAADTRYGVKPLVEKFGLLANDENQLLRWSGFDLLLSSGPYRIQGDGRFVLVIETRVGELQDFGQLGNCQ